MDWRVVALWLVQAVVVALAGGGVGSQIGVSTGTQSAEVECGRVLQVAVREHGRCAVELQACEGR
jgi:hypothetical protein